MDVADDPVCLLWRWSICPNQDVLILMCESHPEKTDKVRIYHSLDYYCLCKPDSIY